MAEYIDGRLDGKTRRSRRPIWIVAGILFVALLAGRTVISSWVDLLWYQSLGYGGVFWKTVGLEAGVFAVASVVTFLLLFGAFTAIRHSHEGDLPSSHAIMFGNQRVNLPVAPALRFLSLGISIVVALLTGEGMVSDWPTLALWWYAPRGRGDRPDLWQGVEFLPVCAAGVAVDR